MVLNESQQKIVSAPFSPTLVIAEAGTGKTTVLTERILYFLKNGVSSTQILAMTFTNFAADEIKTRVRQKIKNNRKIPTFIGTIHSFCSEVLRRDIESLNLNRDHNFELIHEEIQIDIFRRVHSERIHKSRSKSILELLSKWKISKCVDNMQLDEIDLIKYEKSFEEYQKYLEEKNYLDFDDILIFTLKLLETNESVRNYWKNKFTAILVDECQDLNEIQWRIIKKLLPDNVDDFNFFAVGDPNQCIYLFNGAKEDIFDEFQRYFPNLNIFSLLGNYRSGKEIVDYSNSVKKIQNKNAISLSNKKSRIIECDSIEEALMNLIDKKDSLFGWAILFPKKSHANELVAFLIDKEISFRSSNFYLLDDPDIQNIVNMIRVTFFDNSYPLRCVIRSLPISEHSKKELTNKENLPLNTTFFDFFISTEEWKKLPINSEDMFVVSEFIEYIKKIRTYPKNDLIFIYKSILNYFQIDSGDDRFNKFNLFEKWLSHIQSQSPNVSVTNLVLNLESYSFFRKDDIGKNESKFVTLSTIHKAKGLEWKNVIVLEKLFLEQEKEKGEYNKNLLYVAISRAKEELILVK